MVESAQKLEEKLTKEYQTENSKRSQALQDEIIAYINEYNITRKYDAILYKSAGLVFNPALDITDEIIVGLNEKYVKPQEDVAAPVSNQELGTPVKGEDNTVTP